MVTQKTEIILLHPPSSNNFYAENDGIDHINIFSRGKTELGRILSNFAETPFSYDGIDYNSVEGALFYYRTGDKRFINLYGSEAKILGESLKAARKEKPELIRKWLWAKLNFNPGIKEKLLNNFLPFSHYYIFGNKKINKELTCPEIWREITDELKSDLVPFN